MQLRVDKHMIIVAIYPHHLGLRARPSGNIVVSAAKFLPFASVFTVSSIIFSIYRSSDEWSTVAMTVARHQKVPPAGIEPATRWVETSCSNPLSYGGLSTYPGVPPIVAQRHTWCSACKEINWT